MDMDPAGKEEEGRYDADLYLSRPAGDASKVPEAGFEPKVVQRKEPQLYSGATTYRMVASGIGVGIVARPVVSGYRPYDVVFKPLRDPAPALELVAAWRRDDPSSNLQSFLEVVRELAPDETTGASNGSPVLGADPRQPQPPAAATTPSRSG